MKNINQSYHWTLIIIAIIFSMWAVSCSEEARGKMAASIPALGTANQMAVVMDKDLWEGAVGDTFRFYYESAYPILPQPEPIFDIKHFTPYDLRIEPVRKELRTYLFIGNLSNDQSETSQIITKDLGDTKVKSAQSNGNFRTTIARDKWAQGQMLIYQFGFSNEELIENIKKNFLAVAKKVHEADKELIQASTYFGKENKILMKEVQEKIGVSLSIPPDYYLAKHDGNTVWIRKENDISSSNILIHKVPYENENQFSKEGIKAILDTLGQKYIQTAIENSYMHINDVDLPMLTNTMEINGYYTVEAVGIWEMVNDFMGGPFVAYVFHNKKTNELLVTQGFVHAPGKRKRDYMQKIGHVLKTITNF